MNCKRKRMSADSDDEKTDNSFSVVKNKIYFYCEVDRKHVMKLNLAIQSMQNEGYDQIFLYIQSEGGDVYAGLSGMNHIKNSKIPITTVVDGLCASAATFMSIAGHSRQMFDCSEVLIHQIQSGTWGRFEDMKSDMENNEKLMERLKQMYKNFTKIPVKILNKLLSKEIALDANECLKYGIIDTII